MSLRSESFLSGSAVDGLEAGHGASSHAICRSEHHEQGVSFMADSFLEPGGLGSG